MVEDQFRDATVEDHEQWIDANGRSYRQFREGVREAMLDDGWKITSQDVEADFFAKGLVLLYASPGGTKDRPLHVVITLAFPSEAARIRTEAETDVDDEDPVSFYEPDVAVALRRANELVDQEQWIDANGRPYPQFRQDVLRAMTADGWEITGQDVESDYLAKGRVCLYAAPTDGLERGRPPLHRVGIQVFPSEAARIRWHTGLGHIDDEPALHHEYDAAAALERANGLV